MGRSAPPLRRHEDLVEAIGERRDRVLVRGPADEPRHAGADVERLGEDDAPPSSRRSRYADGGLRPLRGRRHSSTRRTRARRLPPSTLRPRLPVTQPACFDDRRGERPPAARAPRRGGPVMRGGSRARRSPKWASSIAWMRAQRRCPAARCSASPSRAPWRSLLRSYSPTSLPAASTHRRASTCWRCSSARAAVIAPS